MFFQKHTYVFSKTYLCFFRNIPMIFQKRACDFSETPYALRYALCIREVQWGSCHGASPLSEIRGRFYDCVALNPDIRNVSI